MASKEILSQDEIDALLKGVKSGEVPTGTAPAEGDGAVRSFDFSRHERIVRGRMPTLEMINNRFCRNLRITLFGFLQRTIDVSFQGVRVMNLRGDDIVSAVALVVESEASIGADVELSENGGGPNGEGPTLEDDAESAEASGNGAA